MLNKQIQINSTCHTFYYLRDIQNLESSTALLRLCAIVRTLDLI